MSHHHHSNQEHPHQTHKKRPIHHQPIVWFAVVLMLAAMAWYVLSFDEALAPGVGTEPQVPAAAE
jgi:hypothetical protein